MLRISKLTDYAVVLTTELANRPAADSVSVSQLALVSGIPDPTVSKVLKLLAQGGVLCSTRGAHGGYRLARPAKDISIAAVIAAIEGPIAITECSSDEELGSCAHEGSCEVRSHWQSINAVIEKALAELSLEEMARRPAQQLVQLELSGARGHLAPRSDAAPRVVDPLASHRVQRNPS